MYNALQFDQMRIQEGELRLRQLHRTPWAQPDVTRTAGTHAHSWWHRSRRSTGSATSA